MPRRVRHWEYNQQRIVFSRDLDHAHLHAAVHCAHQHVDFVPLDQFIGILGRLGRFGFIVDGEIFQFSTGKPAALLRDG